MVEVNEKKTSDKYHAPVIRLRVVKEGSMIYEKPLDSPREAARFAASLFSGLDREYVYAVFVDMKGHINAVENIAIGSLNLAVIEPREIYKSAFLSSQSYY